MIRTTLAAILAAGFAAAVVPAPAVLQAAQPAPLAFEAVSIKENTTVSEDGLMRATPGRFTVTNLDVASMIRYAYGVRSYQLVGVPAWAATPYDVIATYPADIATPTDAQVRGMLQALLADRFGLQTRRETRQLPAFELRVARGDGRLGPQLVPSRLDCDNAPPAAAPGDRFPPCQGFQDRRLIAGKGRRLDALATALEAMVRQKVIDRTGLTGAYDWNVRWAGAQGPAEDAAVEEIAVMTTALEEQLGLKLESLRAPQDVLVVDAVRRPTAN